MKAEALEAAGFAYRNISSSSSDSSAASSGGDGGTKLHVKASEHCHVKLVPSSQMCDDKDKTADQSYASIIQVPRALPRYLSLSPYLTRRRRRGDGCL